MDRLLVCAAYHIVGQPTPPADKAVKAYAKLSQVPRTRLICQNSWKRLTCMKWAAIAGRDNDVKLVQAAFDIALTNQQVKSVS